RTVAAGVLMQDRKVCGAVLLDDHGDFSIVRARVVIDATGNSVVAAQAGATLSEPHYQEPAVQGAGLSPFIPGQVYCNSDYQFIDESDAEDVTRAFVMAHDKFQQEFDVAVLPGTRERRRIVGDVTIQPQDVLLHRRWRDTVAVAASNFDTHGFIQHPMLMMRPPDEEPLQAHVPLRALLPVSLDGMLVTGLSISAHRDAMPVLRMQPDVQNQGYAAGIAAAMAAAAGCPLREVNIAELQRRLLEKEILPSEAVASVDGEIASGNLSADQEILAKIFMRPDKGRREVKSRFLARPNLDDALILAFLGDSTGRELLRTSISGSGWDEGWNYRGMGQFGASGSLMDCLLFALRSIGGAAAEIMRLLAALEPESAFSHFRAVTMYFMRWPHQEAAARLERLLECPGFSGNHVGTLAEAMRSNRPDMNDNSVRNRQLKELYTAAALCCCAPGNDFACKILTAYRDGMSGVYSAFAAQVLEGHGRARISK
ncbi:MAG: FAD-dependent oxidoreductase, partial [Victivallales bacterium]|nr:FAD-dependent oxidoreductase [Victivallales bacterium]